MRNTPPQHPLPPAPVTPTPVTPNARDPQHPLPPTPVTLNTRYPNTPYLALLAGDRTPLLFVLFV